MDLRHLRYFSAVAEAGSIARASLQLHVAQPAVSRQIHDFEAALGYQVFERTTQGVQLTAAGAALLPKAQDILAALDVAAAETVRADAGTFGEVRVAMSHYVVATARVGAALAALREAHPTISFEIGDLTTEAQVEALRAGELDVGIGLYSPADPEIRLVPLYTDTLDCAVLPVTHPLAAERRISIEALRGQRAISLSRMAMRGLPHIVDAIAGHGFEIDDAHESVEAVFWHVAAGNGWALGFASQIRQAPPPGTVAVPFSDFRLDLLMVARARASDRSRMTARVIDRLREAFGRSPAGRTDDPVRSSESVASRAVELRHLEALVAVCEERSLSRAAEHLGLTQSGVSRRIGSLEEALDVHILERGNSSVLPTAAGRVLARHATSIIERWHLALRPETPAIARCRLAIVSTRINEAAVLGVMRSLGTEICEVAEMLSPAVEGAVREGRADVGVCNGYAKIEDPGIASMVLVDDAIECALLPSTHRLAGCKSVRAAQLADDPFLFFAREDTPKLYDLALDELERAGYRPRVATTVTTPRSISTMVAASMGWSLTLRSQISRAGPGLVAVPIEGLHIWAGAQLIWRRSERNARILGVIRAFRDWKGLARSA